MIVTFYKVRKVGVKMTLRWIEIGNRISARASLSFYYKSHNKK
jgi:hypothetical protein